MPVPSKFPRLTAMLLATSAPVVAHAQSQPATTPPATGQSTGAQSSANTVDYDNPADDIVVTGESERGAVIGDIKPDEQLSPADIRAYGVSSVSELLDELAPETGSARGSGPPVVLLNGQRISSFREIRDLPTEAIARVDILPEEVALKYGYRADQRVVNIVLRQRFRAYTAELKDKVPTAGGNNDAEAEGSYLRIHNGSRLNVDLQAETTSRLLESERGIIANSNSGRPYDLFGNVTAPTLGDQIDPALSAAAGTPVTIAGVPASAVGTTPTLSDFVDTANVANTTDTTPYRTLNPASKRASLNASYNRTIFGNVSATANLALENTATSAWQGLPGARFVVPAGNPYSPFSNDVALYRYLSTSPLIRNNNDFTAHAGVTLNGHFAGADPWQWSLTGNYDHEIVTTRTQTGYDTSAFQTALFANDPSVNPFGDITTGALLTDRSHSVSDSGTIDALFTGSLFSLPAGDATTSIKVGGATSNLSSSSTRSGVLKTGSVGRTSGNAQINIDLPIANSERDILSGLGYLSLNANAEVQQLSDFGTLTSVGGGFNWKPIDRARLLVSYTQEQGAPSAAQLGNPVIATPNTRIFDYVTGQTVDVTSISGGNPNLIGNNRHVLKVGLDVSPLKDQRMLRLSAEYVREEIDNPIASFPPATAEIEAAFPDRFTRDASGQLVQVDGRPVNFQRSERQEFRWGFVFSKSIQSNLRRRFMAAGGPAAFGFRGRRGDRSRNPFAAADQTPGQSGQQTAQGGKTPESGAATSAQQPTGATNGSQPGNAQQGAQQNAQQQGDQTQRRGRGGGGRFGGRGRGGGRIQVSLFHTIYLQDRIFIRDGLPALDLLDGSASGNSGGQPRHQVQLRAGISNNGFGGRLNATWNSATHVDGGATGNDSLRFSSLATFDLRLFANLGQQPELVRDHRWLRGTRISLSISNIFNARQRVTTPAGTVPLSYQPGYVDPLGRTISISIRKMFF